MFSNVVLTPEERTEKDFYRQTLDEERMHKIREYVLKNGLTALKSDYLGMDDYYLSSDRTTVYKVCTVCGWDNNTNPVFEQTDDPHIRELNGL